MVMTKTLPMGKIVAIGGGEIALNDTLPIDKRIVELTGKPKPYLLFIPTASGDSTDYYAITQRVYGQQLGCQTDVLYLLRRHPSDQEILEKIAGADAIYVGGGNTLRMMKLWRKRGVDKLLQEAYQQGTVLSGLSAGAICWFAYGHSDSKSFTATDGTWDYIRVRGLGLVSAIYCPHVLSEKRLLPFKAFMKKYPQVGIACDDNAAIEIIDDHYRIITSSSSAKAYRLCRNRDGVDVEEIPQEASHSPLSHLLG
jgi:dipeptidase E